MWWGRESGNVGQGQMVLWGRESGTHDGHDELSCGAGTVVMSGRDSGHDGQG